jgi:predicted nucleic acid-binding protein
VSDPIILDASPLSLLCHPDLRIPEVFEINRWLRAHDQAGRVVYISEITDYEVRRELLRAGKRRSNRKLDALIARAKYVPLDTPTMHRAAELWARVRNEGMPTAPPEALDADVILAAQAERLGAVVATPNVAHLGRFVTAKPWRDIPPE